jgi:hypothetical protein
MVDGGNSSQKECLHLNDPIVLEDQSGVICFVSPYDEANWPGRVSQIPSIWPFGDASLTATVLLLVDRYICQAMI